MEKMGNVAASTHRNIEVNFFRKRTLEPVYLQWRGTSAEEKTEVDAESTLRQFIQHCAFPVRMVRMVLARKSRNKNSYCTDSAHEFSGMLASSRMTTTTTTTSIEA